MRRRLPPAAAAAAAPTSASRHGQPPAKLAKSTKSANAAKTAKPVEPRKPTWDSVCDKLTPHLVERRGVEMASIPFMLTFMCVGKLAKKNLSRSLQGWTRLHGCTQQDVTQAKRKGQGRNTGGSEEACGSLQVLKLIHAKCLMLIND